MPPFAPRYPDRVFRLIEQLDDKELTLAEVARRVGDAAQEERLIRPSPVHVRRLCAELRRVREEERELRQATIDAFLKPLPYRPPSPEELGRARERAEERIRARNREGRR